MTEDWFVKVVVEYSADLTSHLIRAGVPDDVYSLRNAWNQEEVGFGLWKLKFKDNILTNDMRRRIREMGGVPVDEGRPSEETNLTERAEALKSTTSEVR